MRYRPDRFIALGILTIALCAPSSASAQPGVPLPTSWELQRLLLGAVNSIQMLPLSDVACGVDGTSEQPLWSARWDDPAQWPATHVCQWVDAGAGPLRSALPGVQYQMRMTAIGENGRSEFSTLVDFRLPAPTPAVPTGVRVRPGQ